MIFTAVRRDMLSLANAPIPPRTPSASRHRVVAANVSTFPDAWDGAINVQRSYGELYGSAFDVGPFLVTYSSIGRSEPDAG